MSLSMRNYWMGVLFLGANLCAHGPLSDVCADEEQRREHRAVVGTIVEGVDHNRAVFEVDVDRTDPRWVSVTGTPSPFMIGFVGEAASDTLKSQLKLSSGVVVTRVVPDSPAAIAGLQVHDIILNVDGEPLSDMSDFFGPLTASEGKQVELTLVRGGERKTLKVKPVKRPEVRAHSGTNVTGRLYPKFMVVSPGVVLGSLKNRIGGDLRIEWIQEGDEPARVRIQRNDKVWETTADKLDELPEEIRKLIYGDHPVLTLSLDGLANDGDHDIVIRDLDVTLAAPDDQELDQDQPEQEESEVEIELEAANSQHEALRREMNELRQQLEALRRAIEDNE